VIELLTTRTRRIERELAGGAALLRGAEANQVEEAYLLAAHYVQAQLTTELNWLTDLIGRLERKELQWPNEDPM
jgi:hypothetical protein